MRSKMHKITIEDVKAQFPLRKTLFEIGGLRGYKELIVDCDHYRTHYAIYCNYNLLKVTTEMREAIDFYNEIDI
jgi:hypothetical protein